jgi:hypothetical protein
MQLITLRSSTRFAALKWAAAGTTLVAVGALMLDGAFVAVCGILLAALLIVVPALRVKMPQGSLRLRREGFCEWLVPGGPAAEMTVAGLFEAADWLILRLAERGAPSRLGFIIGGKGLVLVLAPDALSREEMRQLRVWLRLAAPRANLNSGGAQWS